MHKTSSPFFVITKQYMSIIIFISANFNSFYLRLAVISVTWYNSILSFLKSHLAEEKIRYSQQGSAFICSCKCNMESWIWYAFHTDRRGKSLLLAFICYLRNRIIYDYCPVFNLSVCSEFKKEPVSVKFCRTYRNYSLYSFRTT